MGVLKNRMGEKIHTRKIDIATYECDGQTIIVEGRLKDDRLKPYHTLLGKRCDPSTIHHMIIRIAVESASLQIIDVEAEMPAAPEDECHETLKSLQDIKGLKITGGFTGRVKKLLGGIKGCSHLKALLLSMAPAALQGHFALFAREPFPDGLTADEVKQFLGDTCMVWRKDGPLLNEIEEALTRKGQKNTD